MPHALARLATAATLALFGEAATASGCFWSHFDHRIAHDASGAWNPELYRDIVIAASAAQLGGALWQGSDSRFGRTLWQGVESEILSDVSAEAGKYVFTRVRPAQSSDPCLWFEGGSNHSFPSGEAATAAGLVAPLMLEYGAQQPLVYGLLALPVYVGVARVKNQAHWQSDVVAGWAIGGLAGWYEHARGEPILVGLLPHGVTVGIRREF